jgi:uncharacterized protein
MVQNLFLDTALVQAIYDKHDQYHQKATTLSYLLRPPQIIWTTEAVLVEIGNALSAIDRVAASSFIKFCYNSPNFRVIEVTSQLLEKGLKLYDKYHDKDWGLTDCISFVVMQEQGLMEALTSDQHFVQAGFLALLRQ